MATYSVYRRDVDSADDVVFVKEGFCWPAFLFSLPWCLWHRMWLAAAAIFAVLVLLGTLFGDAAAGILSFAACLIVGWEAAELRRLSLTASGYREIALVPGGTIDDAELRYFASATGSGHRAPMASQIGQAGGHDPLGLFGTP